MKFYFILVFSFLFSFDLIADPIKNQLDQAEKFLSEENYIDAVNIYQDLYNQKLYSKELLFNWGYANYKLERFPEAALAYEKLLKKWPNYQKGKHNLSLVREAISSEITALPEFFVTSWWKSTAAFFVPIIWWMLLVLVLTLAVYNYYQFALRNKNSKEIWWNIVLLILATLFFFLARQSHVLRNQTQYALNLQDCDFRNEPNMASTILFELTPGEKVKLLSAVDIWYKVELANKEVGWVLRKDVTEI